VSLTFYELSQSTGKEKNIRKPGKTREKSKNITKEVRTHAAVTSMANK